MTYVFLREDGESASNAVARCAEEALAKGPMADTVRGDDYEAFLHAAYGDGKAARHIATSCAVFAGACAINSGAQPKRGIPKARAITTWAGVRGFIEDKPETEAIEGSWIPVHKLDAFGGPKRGDVFYICGGTSKTWPAATNGHVGILLGDGWVVRTAEGGGSPGGTGCRMSAVPKDIRTMGRTLRGVWRPDLFPPNKPTVPDGIPHTDIPAFIPLKYGDVSARVGAVQLRLNALGYPLPITFGLVPSKNRKLPQGVPDKGYGNETAGAIEAFQQSKGLPVNRNVVDEATWNALFMGAP